MKKIISNAIFHLPKNKFQYSSLPSHNNKNNLEEFVKKEIFSSLQVCSKTKTILEDEDTQDETIKQINALRYSLEKEMKIGLSHKENYIIKLGTLEYIKQQNFFIEDENLEPVITLSKTIGNEYSIELCARAIERDMIENNQTKDRFIHNLAEMSDKFQVKNSSGYMLPKEKKLLFDSLMSSMLNKENPFGVKRNQTFLFNIIISDFLKNQGLKFFCALQENEIVVGQIEILEDSTKNKESAKKLLFDPIKPHLTQNFLTLSDKLQKNFVDYIKSFGVTPYLCYHLEYLSYLKEEINYLNWIREMHNHSIKLFELKINE